MIRNLIKSSLVIILGIGILSGCSQKEQVFAKKETVSFSNEMTNYMEEKYGYPLNSILNDGTIIESESAVNLRSEYLSQYEEVGVDLKPYVGEYLFVYEFPLKESCLTQDGEEIQFSQVFLESNGELIGDYLIQSNPQGGRFKTQTIEDLFEELGCS
ncbi:hypothetical protein [Jeotgalibacillus sp. R-1-5s-1]|uniref:hypothetical protein n=1 Tax=Jeotgalibacillus sp. R-1-5s-1 TaxID=2555897 RepID=UPI001068F822|nr:hypothetical protein [Jeotgalibacillus sp. R-1-5s-1]TFD97048.1 hypothetical protein E2491_10155 [Jeotgalibacillus sp. R-1-5s-1]